MTTVRARPLNFTDRTQKRNPRTKVANVLSSQKLFLLTVMAHLPLGVLLYNIGNLALLHPLAAFAWGLRWAIDKKVPLNRVALPVGYLIGAEVLWRMAQVPVFWEFGKYGSAAIMVTAIFVRGSKAMPAAPAIYFICLIPSCLLTLLSIGFSESVGPLSSNMSGPLCLAISGWFFSRLRISSEHLRSFLMVIGIPLISVATVTLFYTVTAENISFNTESNFATSGGFGPNQVSTMLGLGLFLAGLLLILFQQPTFARIVTAIAALFFAGQSVMTFSRSGVYNAIGALTIVLILSFSNIIDGLKRVIPVTLIAVVFIFLVFPYLNTFTEGKLQERFEETDTSRRSDLMVSDFEMFSEYPVLGTGAGNSRGARKEISGTSAMNHTEFTRLISEHGSLGLMALGTLAWLMLTNILKQRTKLGRAVAAGTACWGVLYMFNSGMRLAAPAVMIGLGSALIVTRVPGRLRATINRF